MESESKSSIEAAEERKIPEDLLQKLHAATERFHRAREAMEKSVGDAEYSHQQRIDQATEQMRVAEREVEEITMRIHGSLTPPPPIEPSH